MVLGSTEIKMHQRGLSLSLEGPQPITMEYGERSEMRCGDYLFVRIRICDFISIDILMCIDMYF